MDLNRQTNPPALDSRHVLAGDVFFALSGTKSDGSEFIAQAIEKGASAIVGEKPIECAVPFIKVENARRELALYAARHFAKQPEFSVAVTGTSGKTSVAAFTRQMFEGVGVKAASLGTIGLVKPGGETYSSLTTPDPITLFRTLRELHDEHVTHFCFEASSHGLDQYRLDGVRLKAAAFTNLSRDHLDYHGTIEEYLRIKTRLFSEILPSDGKAVIMQGEFSQPFIDIANKRGQELITIGGAGSLLGIRDIEMIKGGQKLTLELYGRRYFVEIPFIGRFQAENILTAAGLCMACGCTLEELLPQMPYLEGAKGRLEEVGRKNNAPILIDYAHKPDALEKALQTLRPFVKGKLIVVFGCGGDRDKGKRAIMGEIATRLADVTIITDDNPRSENPATIRAEILSQAPKAVEFGDRAAAINHAVKALNEGDVLLIAGKGHETGQIIAGVTHHFSDHECVKEALK